MTFQELPAGSYFTRPDDKRHDTFKKVAMAHATNWRTHTLTRIEPDEVVEKAATPR